MSDRIEEVFDVKKWMGKESYPECWVEIPVKSDDGSTSVENYKLSDIIKEAVRAAVAEIQREDGRNLERIGEGLRRMMSGDRSGMSAQHMLEIVEQTLGLADQRDTHPTTGSSLEDNRCDTQPDIPKASDQP